MQLYSVITFSLHHLPLQNAMAPDTKEHYEKTRNLLPSIGLKVLILSGPPTGSPKTSCDLSFHVLEIPYASWMS